MRSRRFAGARRSTANADDLSCVRAIFSSIGWDLFSAGGSEGRITSAEARLQLTDKETIVRSRSKNLRVRLQVVTREGNRPTPAITLGTETWTCEAIRDVFHVLATCDTLLTQSGSPLRQTMSTPGQNLTLPPVENLTVRRGDEPQAVATS